VRRTNRAVFVLSFLDETRWRCGSDVTAATGLDSSTVSKILRALAGEGCAVSQLEERGEAEMGPTRETSRHQGARARRRYYRLTSAGVALRELWRAEAEEHPG